MELCTCKRLFSAMADCHAAVYLSTFSCLKGIHARDGQPAGSRKGVLTLMATFPHASACKTSVMGNPPSANLDGPAAFCHNNANSSACT